MRGVIDAGFMDRLEYKREDALVQIVIHNGRKTKEANHVVLESGILDTPRLTAGIYC